ncbi:MAG: VanZ family protein [Clostridia bacterium]|nr:VanZ family protein [Clostridia bacterium]
MTKKQIILAILFALAAIIITVIILFSMQSGTDSNAESGIIAKLVRPIIDPEGKMTETELQYIVRKTAHFTEYFILGAVLSAIALIIAEKFPTPWIFMSLFFTLLTAVTDEFIQSFVERTSLVSDVVLDFYGCMGAHIIAVAVYFIIRAVKKRKIKADRIDTL